MANLNVNKVIYGGDVLIDLTGDSVSADKILKGIRWIYFIGMPCSDFYVMEFYPGAVS